MKNLTSKFEIFVLHTDECDYDYMVFDTLKDAIDRVEKDGSTECVFFIENVYDNGECVKEITHDVYGELKKYEEGRQRLMASLEA